MKDFTTAQIRNVALVAHHGVGKTSLAESMLFLAKATTRLGRIADGTTLLDYAADEIASLERRLADTSNRLMATEEKLREALADR